MAEIVLDGISHNYREPDAPRETYALKEVNLSWHDGGAYALLGPSGCGKTTMLNLISGLLTPTHGRILFNGKDVTRLSTQQRNIAQVFQFPVIYDTMTVEQNLAFPLRNRGLKEPEIRRRVAEVAELLELNADLKHRASGLTADVKQIVSLGRGLVRKDVSAVLLDEPLTVIDPHAKWQLRSTLKAVHQQFNLTLIYVTHDQIEALTFADQVVVMYEGEVVQVGTPQALFEDPQHTFVGHFIGSPGMNLFPCRVEGKQVYVNDLVLPIPSDQCEKAAARSASRLSLGIRPEFIHLAREEDPGAMALPVARVEDLGQYKIVTAGLGERPVKIKLPEDAIVQTGETRWFAFSPGHIKLYAEDRAI